MEWRKQVLALTNCVSKGRGGPREIDRLLHSTIVLLVDASHQAASGLASRPEQN
jgi:hypothetical protein